MADKAHYRLGRAYFSHRAFILFSFFPFLLVLEQAGLLPSSGSLPVLYYPPGLLFLQLLT